MDHGKMEAKKKLIIVYRKRNARYAHFMAQLISASTNYQVAEWEEKHWESNKPTTPASQRVIFLGKAGDDYNVGVKWIYDEFGMKYGWLSTQCILAVSSMPSKQIDAFKEHYKERAKHFEHIAEEKEKEFKPKTTPKIAGAGAVAGFIGGVVNVLVAAPVVAWNVYDAVASRSAISDCQKQLLICEFVLEGGLDSFMESK